MFEAIRSVITLDVHSDVAFACIDKLVNISAEMIWRSAWLGKPRKQEILVVVVPDQGALKKLAGLSSLFEDTVIAVKSRNTQTGRLELKGLVGDVSGKRCVIVDDICDGGGTFILLAKKLFEWGAQSVDLAVTHGIFTKGRQVLYDAGISSIFTTDSFPQGNTKEFVLSVKEFIQ